jgi:hypothetical protein
MADVENPNNLLGFLDAEDDSVRFEEKLPNRVFEVVVLSGKSASPGIVSKVSISR